MKSLDPIPDKMSTVARWTDDCSGKKDYDAPLISLSTRYWPRGGSHLVVHSVPGKPVKIEGGEERPEIRPSASASILINFAEDLGLSGVLANQEFEADTPEEVKAQVEAWAQARMDQVVAALRREFGR